MTQSFLPIAALLAQLPDNTTRSISPQKVRDLVVSLSPFIASRDPTPNDDNADTSGVGGMFDLGQWWFNQAFNRLWFCVTGATGAAVWIQLPVGGTTALQLFWAAFDPITPTTISSNIPVSFTRNGVGDYNIRWSQPLSFLYWPCFISVYGPAWPWGYTVTPVDNSETQVFIFDSGLSNADPNVLWIMALG